MGEPKSIILVIQDQGSNSERFIEPTRNQSIILVVQDQRQISKGFIKAYSKSFEIDRF